MLIKCNAEEADGTLFCNVLKTNKSFLKTATGRLLQ